MRVNKRFDITKIIRIERSADEDDIANKWCDFSLGTISKLFEQGTLDALKTLAKEIMISKMDENAFKKDKKESIQDAIQLHSVGMHLIYLLGCGGTRYKR